MDLTTVLPTICVIAEKAAREIMRVYDRAGHVEKQEKNDGSPLTEADLRSHTLIIEELQNAFEFPIISEENRENSITTLHNNRYVWLVDPLDGTKEFIKRNGEFTVNIALLEDRQPIAGVITVPVKNISYYGALGMGCFQKIGTHAPNPLAFRTHTPKTPVRIAKSRSHSTPGEKELLNTLQVEEILEAGSSLKFCLVCEGKADFYIRSGPTSEWDTAAGHALIRAQGGYVTTRTGPLTYGKKDFINPGFIASASLEFAQLAIHLDAHDN
jgi:3'(2'), 5'-bisphosphate nucleotidase